MSSAPAGDVGSSFFRQPRAVWATAFAAVVGFMGIGLVDPILTSIAEGLQATPSQVSLLFTSYFAVTSVMMLATGFVSSRIGGRRTLLLGAALIACFAALAGTSHSVTELVLYRAGWGLGNAFFVATALSVIVAAASGGTATAILLYEAALGLGISVGPLLGAALGSLSWRYPFFGTAALMTIGFVAIALFLEAQPKAARKTSLVDPIRALGHRGLLSVAGSAFFYNYAFFTVLAFVPFVLQASAHTVGLIFFGWGLALAVFSVLVAPRLQILFSALTLGVANLVALAVLLLGMAFGSVPIIVAAVVLSGAVMGINNTVFTEMALEISPFPRPVASAAYNFVRWFAGVIAPYAAPKIAEHFGASASFVVAAVSALAAAAVLLAMRGNLGRFTAKHPKPDVAAAAVVPSGPILVALDGTANDRAILARAAKAAAAVGAPVEVLHICPLELVEGEAAVAESSSGSAGIVDLALAELHAAGLQAAGAVREELAASLPQAILDHADALDARLIVLGGRHHGDPTDLVHGSVADIVGRRATRPVMLVPEVRAD
ncbi:MFS family permease [Rhodopseudomonas rhenobacensis]|uniref:MFS family permease n=1 Tax=Rhodopseudomonas rhenobacensis TaxID=87461 RepID=A0A7W8DZQ4_9BRAD|nr:MFS transporter [Rhodopseudomonas rhenobacensis]MBB5048303.1 MFS family permease [Rhodopseudomonas rhenobacensis]